MVAKYFIAWLGLMAVPCACMVMAIHSLVRRKRHWLLRTSACVAAALVTFFFAGMVNWICFQPPAVLAQQAMIADGGNVIGQPASALRTRYGPPKKIHQDERVPGQEHWWYAPGPWFVMDDDYVGFIVEDGIVKKAYLQVN